MPIINSRLYWRLRASLPDTLVRKWVKPIAVMVALVRAHDFTYPLPSEKRELLLRIARDFECFEFVETGTFAGDTTAFMAEQGLQCTTIELQPELATRARHRFAGQSSVRVIHGDSAVVLPLVISQLTRPTLFWLDAHFSSGSTAGAGEAPPLLSEIGSILADRRFEHCIAIDDARDLLGVNGYPDVRRLAGVVDRVDRGYSVRIVNDVVLITPARM